MATVNGSVLNPDVAKDDVLRRRSKGSATVMYFMSPGYVQLGLPELLDGLNWRYRDGILRQTIYREAMWAAAIRIAESIAANFAWEVDRAEGETQPLTLKKVYAHDLVLYANGRKGWGNFARSCLRDFLTTDNGQWWYVQRSQSAYGGRVIGLWHLDSLRCLPTGDDEQPCIYYHPDGYQYELQWWQVVRIVDSPDPRVEMLGRGFCAASAQYEMLRIMASIQRYLFDKVSGRRALSINFVKGISTKQIEDGMTKAKEKTLEEGNIAYLGSPVIGIPNPDGDVSVATIQLASMPDGFDRKEIYDEYILHTANAIGLDPGSLRPLTGTLAGTATQSEIQHDKAQEKGLSYWVQQVGYSLNDPDRNILGSGIKFIWSDKDERDRQQRAQTDNLIATGLRTLAGPNVPLITDQAATEKLIREDVFMRDELPDTGAMDSGLADDETSDDAIPDAQQNMQITQDAALPVIQGNLPVQKQITTRHPRVTASDVDKAIKDWRKNAPSVMQDLLDAEAI